MLLLVVGLVLHTITRRFQELEHQLRLRDKQPNRRREAKYKGITLTVNVAEVQVNFLRATSCPSWFGVL